jgi:hypothetical protein
VFASAASALPLPLNPHFGINSHASTNQAALKNGWQLIIHQAFTNTLKS